MPEPAKIRNVAVVGHRGTGKTSLVEALLFQSGAVNRLGTVEAGTTVSDSDEDEHSRQLSISTSLAHTEWQGRKLNLVDVPGDPSFQGELRTAARVVEGVLVTVSSVMGVEVGTSRAWKLADELGLARIVFVNMLDRERADFYRTLEQLRTQLGGRCVAVHLPIGEEHESPGSWTSCTCARMRARRARRRATPGRSRTSWRRSPPSTARSSSTPWWRPTRGSWSVTSKGRSSAPRRLPPPSRPR